MLFQLLVNKCCPAVFSAQYCSSTSCLQQSGDTPGTFRAHRTYVPCLTVLTFRAHRTYVPAIRTYVPCSPYFVPAHRTYVPRSPYLRSALTVLTFRAHRTTFLLTVLTFRAHRTYFQSLHYLHAVLTVPYLTVLACLRCRIKLLTLIFGVSC
jgi:hypothetical protein